MTQSKKLTLAATALIASAVLSIGAANAGDRFGSDIDNRAQSVEVAADATFLGGLEPAAGGQPADFRSIDERQNARATAVPTNVEVSAQPANIMYDRPMDLFNN